MNWDIIFKEVLPAYVLTGLAAGFILNPVVKLIQKVSWSEQDFTLSYAMVTSFIGVGISFVVTIGATYVAVVMMSPIVAFLGTFVSALAWYGVIHVRYDTGMGIAFGIAVSVNIVLYVTRMGLNAILG